MSFAGKICKYLTFWEEISYRVEKQKIYYFKNNGSILRNNTFVEIVSKSSCEINACKKLVICFSF